MENEISNKYIDNAINELESSFGIKEPISGENIFSLIRSGKVKDAMKLIARQLDLPIDINITNQDGANQFQSTALSRGSEGITAQVSIPGNLPFYGSSALNGYPIKIKISENCTGHPATFSMIMAHELSHVLLYSLIHPKKNNEFYTDLTAIMLGFQNIFQKGRKITTTEITTTYCYLSDEQFNFACSKVNSLLEKNLERKKKLSDEFNKFKKLLSKHDKTVCQFKNFIEYISKNRNKNISGEDGKRMVMFFQPGYMDDLDSLEKQYKQKIETIGKFIKDLSHYTKQNNNQISDYNSQLKNYNEELKNKLLYLKKDVKMLKKYISLIYRIKVSFF